MESFFCSAFTVSGKTRDGKTLFFLLPFSFPLGLRKPPSFSQQCRRKEKIRFRPLQTFLLHTAKKEREKMQQSDSCKVKKTFSKLSLLLTLSGVGHLGSSSSLYSSLLSSHPSPGIVSTRYNNEGSPEVCS